MRKEVSISNLFVPVLLSCIQNCVSMQQILRVTEGKNDRVREKVGNNNRDTLACNGEEKLCKTVNQCNNC